MEFLGIKIGDQLLLANPFYLQLLLIVFALGVIKLAFGKEILWLVKKVWDRFSSRDKNKKHTDWTADCVQREGWIQKGDALSLDLEGRYLKRLSFFLSPLGTPANWRGGFILGNENFHPQFIVDEKNAITIHAGSPPPVARAIHIWKYDESHGRDNPDSTTVTAIDKKRVYFLVEINNHNSLAVFVNNQQVYSKRIDSSFRKKVYLLAWGDNADCKVRFTEISHSI